MMGENKNYLEKISIMTSLDYFIVENMMGHWAVDRLEKFVALYLSTGDISSSMTISSQLSQFSEDETKNILSLLICQSNNYNKRGITNHKKKRLKN